MITKTRCSCYSSNFVVFFDILLKIYNIEGGGDLLTNSFTSIFKVTNISSAIFFGFLTNESLEWSVDRDITIILNDDVLGECFFLFSAF